ncbi:MAG: nitroreductase family protein [Symbiobacteriaceae bacterium]|nr:nitroreductase family protein [Symbiobacteriaceae bacterium]
MMSTNHDAAKQTALEVRRAARHFAMLYFNFCHTLVQTYGEDVAFPLVQKAVFNLSLERTDLNRARALAAGASLDLEAFTTFNDLPTIGWSAWDESMGGMRCPYAEQWVTYYPDHPWFAKFASLYCDVIDTTNIENFSGTLSHRITKNLLWGDTACDREYFLSEEVQQGNFTYGTRDQADSSKPEDFYEEEQVVRLFNLTDEDYLALEEVEFRARFRERLHHTLEIQTYASAYRGASLNPNQTATAKRLCNLWQQRGLSLELHDYRYAVQLISFAEAIIAGKPVDLSPYAPIPVTAEEREGFFRIVRQRRSVREFTSKRVPDEVIDLILEAGIWAAHSCNLQSIRYLVIREESTPGLFVGSDVPGGPVHLVVCQDMRVYKANPFNPERNQLLDAGAAAQNIALAAHAAGLEGVWLTFNEAMLQRLRAHFNLPEYINIVTYVDVGYGDQTPYPVLRPKVAEVTLGRC